MYFNIQYFKPKELKLNILKDYFCCQQFQNEFSSTLTNWYSIHKENLPWRNSKNPIISGYQKLFYNKHKLNRDYHIMKLL